MKSKNNYFTLRSILAISFILISAIPVTMLAFWVQQTALENEIEAVKEKHLIIAENLTNAIERYIEDAKFAFQVAVSEGVRLDHHIDDVKQQLKRLNFENIWEYSINNHKILYQIGSEKFNTVKMPVSVLSFVKRHVNASLLENRNITVSGVMYNEYEKPVFTMMLKSADGLYFIGTLNTDYMKSVQKTISFGKRGHAAIVDQHGLIIAHPNREWRDSMKDISFLSPVQKMKSGLTGVTQFYTPAMETEMIAGHTVVINTGWGVMIPQPVSELYDRAYYAREMALYIAFIGVTIAALISLWLSTYLTRSLNQVTKFTETGASGRLDSHIILDRSFIPLEIHQLVISFNHMIDKLKFQTDNYIYQNDRFLEAQNIAKLGNWKLNISDNSMWWSDETYRILGLKNVGADLKLSDMVELMEKPHQLKFLDLLQKSIQNKKPFGLDCKQNFKDNRMRFFHQDVIVHTNKNDEVDYLSGAIQDVTKCRIQGEELYFQANYDSITQLPNRDLCLINLEKRLYIAKTERRILAFFHIGLDHFKEVNGSLGHNIGDKLLILASERLKSLVSDVDFVSRFSSDEFTIILSSGRSMDEIHQTAKNIIQKFQKSFTVDHCEVLVGASIGISVYPEFDALNPLLLLQKADTALRMAKSQDRGSYCLFDESMNERLVSRMNLRSELSTALKNNEFHMVYQPIVDSKTGAIICAESLIRWENSAHGFVSPEQFIPLAEESGYIAEIGLWVIDQACQELKNWHNIGFSHLTISVNLSLRQIQLGLNKQDILSILEKYDLEPSFLTLEITESLLMEDLDRNLVWLNDVRSTGIHFSIDDFGTGYSSLSYLLNLPVSTLKIDRSFVANILFGEKDETLIEMIISLSKKLDFNVIAEGVETQSQLDKLNKFNCDLIQGYFFGKPLRSAEFQQYLEKHRDEFKEAIHHKG